jgi:hypothetical protein
MRNPTRKIIWHGDLKDDCWAKVGNVMAHCECMGLVEIRDHGIKRRSEYWYCSVGTVNKHGFLVGDYIFHSSEPGGSIMGGTMARAICEAILSAYHERRA